VKEWQKYIETDLKEILTIRYPAYMKTYMRYRERIGPHCAYCKGAAKTMYQFEQNRRSDFVERVENGNWENYS